ncbi:hypothetical protein [Bacillus sp. UMB0893]|nr:hypothetical protein [Bacillus sp. UMB0893]
MDLIEQSLTRSSQLQLSALIIDFSGVYKVDEIVVDSFGIDWSKAYSYWI